MAYEATLIPGDGTGPEICEVVKKIVGATGVDIKVGTGGSRRRYHEDGGNAAPR